MDQRDRCAHDQRRRGEEADQEGAHRSTSHRSWVGR
jgi:hypothetical protein